MLQLAEAGRMRMRFLAFRDYVTTWETLNMSGKTAGLPGLTHIAIQQYGTNYSEQSIFMNFKCIS